MYEFAITDGVGRLIDYGICRFVGLNDIQADLKPGEVVLFGYCSQNCVTGL